MEQFYDIIMKGMGVIIIQHQKETILTSLQRRKITPLVLQNPSGRLQLNSFLFKIFLIIINQLMTDKSQTFKAKLIKLQNLLTTQTVTQTTIYYIQELLGYFNNADLGNEAIAKNQVYEELRDTVKAIFTYLDRIRIAYNQITRNIENNIKKLLIAISKFCSAFYCHYHPLGCGEMIREFLSSQCRLFVVQIAAAVPSIEDRKQKQGERYEDYTWQWAKECSYKTIFFSRCIEVIMVNLAPFESKFEEMRVTVIGQYLRLLYYMDDYISKDKIEKLCVSHIEALQKLFRNPSKEIMKEASKEGLEEVIDYSIKLLRNFKNEELKRRVNLLGVTLGMSMIKIDSIEKKIVGSKIVNKFSYEMLYKNNFHLTQQLYTQWLSKQGFFEAIFEDHCQASIVKLSDDTFKIMMKRSCISKEKFQRFFQILEKADSQLRKAMFRLIDPFRVDYYQVQAINQIFKTLRGVEFYDDEFFYFYEGISRYATQSQLHNMLAVVQEALKQYYGKFHTYLTRRRAIQCFAYIFQKLIIYKDMKDRINSYKKVAQQFLEDPSESKIIMLKTLYNNLTESKLSIYYQEDLATEVIEEMEFLRRSFPAANNPQFKEDLIYFIRGMLHRYKSNLNRKGFSKELLLQAVQFPEIFEEMLKISKESEVQGLLEQLSNLVKVKEFSFSCIKWTFIRINQKCLRPIKKGYADVVVMYATNENIKNFIGIDILTYLIFNSQRDNIRKGACELLAEVATNFTTQFRQQGQIYLIQYMKTIFSVIFFKISEFLAGNQTLTAVKGSLQLIEQFLLNTQYFGVGSLKAHNSQIPTSSVWIKIYNNCLQNDDTQKVFQKKFPSNKTLFEVIAEVSNQFKLGPLDIGLEIHDFDIIKYHGLTLEELKLNGQVLNAVKLPQSRCKIEPMIVDGELSQKAKVIFTQIFNRFAVNGYMTQNQCANYIGGVTITYCPVNDNRISDLFYRYDTDKDGKINLEDFLHFYKDCILDPHRLENVQKNLYNLHYRSDLLPYNGEIDFNEEVLFRYYIWKNKEIYECLFKLSNADDVYLAHLAQTIILRLPTYDKIISSLADTFDLKGKNSFEIQYMLTALQTHLNSQEGIGKALISKDNHLSIFEYLCILEQKKIKLQNDKNCMIICLHVLRTLLGNFNLKELNLKKPELAFELPKTDVFISIIKESIENHDSTLLEPAFALQLTQSQLPESLLKQSAFSSDKDTRVLTCHFLYLWLLSDKGKELNLFDIEISPINNEEWFSLLTFAIHFNAQVDFHQVFSNKLKAIASNTESLEGNRCNPIILGSLKLIKEVHYKLNVSQREQLKNCLDSLLPSLISNENRSIVYDLRIQQPEVLLEDLEKVVKIKMSKQGQPRNRFVGIRNLGCICYMNSILQQFFMIKQFYNLVMSLEAKKEVTQVNNAYIVDDFLAQLQEMYINLQLSQKQYYDPSNFCLAIKDTQGKPINTHIQEDAHQFLNSAFDKIEGYTKKEERLTELERLFGGKTVTEIICQSCKNKKEVLEHYYHLSVEVKGMKSLKESFDKLIQIQEISDYFCEGCNTRVEKITKQMLIKESPEILIINLQRIIFDLETFLKVKVHTKLQFQHSLDLSSYFSSSSQPVEYKLKGVVIHAGTSEGGHYYSLIKQGDKWYKFNDQSVTLFNEADIGREAFGGEEVTDHWGEHSSSTNAYILFYERSKQSQEELLERKHSVNKELIEKVQKDNEEFAKQIQFNQPSFFSALNRLVTKYAKPYSPQHKSIVERLCSIHFQVISHFTVNSDIKTQIITQVKDNLLVLLDILPQRSYQFLKDFDLATFKDSLCNNDVNIRDIYAKILGKSLKEAFASNDEEISQKGNYIFAQLLEFIEDQTFMKNLHKSYQFFEMFKDLITANTRIRNILIENDLLAAMLDLLMGTESILNPNDNKKKAEFHSSEAIPVISIINLLIIQKFSSKDSKQNQEKLSELQKDVLNEPRLYKKMMKNKLDIGLLAPIISFMAFNNEKYSKMIAEVLLRGMNSNDQIQDKNIVFTNIRAFLLIEDELTLERKKWILGIAQMDSINDKKPEFGLMTSSESLVYTYISSLFYIRDEKYQPFLFTLFEKRKYFNSFSAYGALALLQLANESAHVRDYILTLPAPTYMQSCYFDWIQTYRNRIKLQEHYGLPIDKKVLAEKLTKLLQDLRGKLISNPLYLQLPVNKYIIGKNVQLTHSQNYFTEQIKITLYTHQTYVLENKPYGNGNLSLPDDQFSFASTKDPLTAKYFLKCAQESFEEQIEIEKRLTMLTFEITAQCPLAISFKIPGFSHKIYLKSGVHVIYTPYHDETLMNMIEIQQIQKQQKKMEQAIQLESISAPPNYLLEQPSSIHLEIPPAPPMIFTDDFFQIECKVCTFLNENRHKCEMCDSDLLT